MPRGFMTYHETGSGGRKRYNKTFHKSKVEAIRTACRISKRTKQFVVVSNRATGLEVAACLKGKRV